MKVLIIGGVAAGTKAAAKLRRENAALDVTLVTKDMHISYAGCGLPYYVGGVIAEPEALFVKTPSEFQTLTGAKIHTRTEAVAIWPDKKQVLTRHLRTKAEQVFEYDELVLATGASPVVPPIPGRDLKNVFTVRTPDDAMEIRDLVEDSEVKRATVVGGGFIGLEVAENLTKQGVKVTLVEMTPQVLPGFDEEIAWIAQDHLQNRDIEILTGEKVLSVEGAAQVEKIITDRREIPADLLVLSVGVRPNSQIAKEAGIAVNARGAIIVDETMRTSTPHVYAVGDCAVNRNLVTGKEAWYPMGSTANKTGRIAALNIAGQQASLPGVLGTTVVKLFDLQAARTGLSTAEARAAGFDVVTVLVPANDKAHYYPDAKEITTKLIADRASGRILGAQIAGCGVVDKPIDILATAITFKAKVEDLERLDLAYAPPFSMAMASTIVAANVLRNKLEGKFTSLTPVEYWRDRSQYKIVDTRDSAAYAVRHMDGTINVPVTAIPDAVKGIAPEDKILLICKIGKNAYLAYRKLKAMGYRDITMLEGGMSTPIKPPAQ